MQSLRGLETFRLNSGRLFPVTVKRSSFHCTPETETVSVHSFPLRRRRVSNKYNGLPGGVSERTCGRRKRTKAETKPNLGRRIPVGQYTFKNVRTVYRSIIVFDSCVHNGFWFADTHTRVRS